MKKLALLLAVAFTMTTTTATFAHEKCKAGKSCCKKMKTASAHEKAMCKKACSKKAA